MPGRAERDGGKEEEFRKVKSIFLRDSVDRSQVHLLYNEVAGPNQRFPKWGPQSPRVL